MGNNKEIRQEMEAYRSILLVFNWIGAVILIIVGIVLANEKDIQGIGIGVIIGAIVLGIIGHFLINVALAIPFILLNNGDVLESLKSNTGSSSGSNSGSILPSVPAQVNFGDTWTCKKCSEKNPISSTSCKGCGEYK
jgi:hypothetical protein